MLSKALDDQRKNADQTRMNNMIARRNAYMARAHAAIDEVTRRLEADRDACTSEIVREIIQRQIDDPERRRVIILAYSHAFMDEEQARLEQAGAGRFRFYLAIAITLGLGIAFLASAAYGLGNRERVHQEDMRR